MKQEAKAKIKNFFDLDTWKQSHELVLRIYKLTRKFPREEQFGLISQLRRAAVSITSNIAEGFSRHSYKEKAQFYSMALGSLTEVHNQLIISLDVGYVSKQEYDDVTKKFTNINKMLNSLIKKSKEIHDSGFMLPASSKPGVRV